MFLLALYPGSGDTYISNLLKNHLNIDFKTLTNEIASDAKVIKTQKLPIEIPESILNNRKIILLIRDGRDCILNNSYYRFNTITQLTSIEENINDAILAPNGSHFGGWSMHTEAWIQRADYIIRFEELVENPLKELTRLSYFLHLIPPITIEPYNFKIDGDHKSAEIKNTDSDESIIPEGWENAFTSCQKELFLKYHGTTAVKLSYHQYEDFQINSIQEFYPSIYQKLGYEIENKKPYRILIEGSKLLMPYNDGTKRYVIELIKGLKDIVAQNPNYDIYIFDSNKYESIHKFDAQYYLNIIECKLSNKQIIKNALIGPIKTAVVVPIKSTLSTVLSVENYLIVKLEIKKLKLKIKRTGSISKSFLYSVLKAETTKSRKKTRAKFCANDFDLVHIPLFQHAEYILQSKEKALITVHDLTHISHPQYHQSNNIALANYGLELALKLKCAFFSISKNTEFDFKNRFPSAIHLDKIAEAADEKVFFPDKNQKWKDTIRKKVGLKGTDEFFLSVSTLEPRKNLKNAIIAFQKAIPQLPENVYFVVVGKNGWKMKEVLPEIDGISDRIIFTGFMPEEFLPWLYREAIALVYISHYEGFGLPILEAMSCKTPVIFGNNSSMIEVVEDSGYPVDTNNIEEITQTIIRVATNKTEVEEKSFLALKQSNTFNWQKTALQTLDLYKKRIEMLKKEE